MFVNGLGAVATGITVVVVLVAKFTQGAWMTALLIPGLLWLMMSVRRHFDRVEKEMKACAPLEMGSLQRPLVVFPIDRWGKVQQNALQFALTISPDIQAVHVKCEDEKDEIQTDWSRFVEAPAKQAGLAIPKLVMLESPYRSVIGPIVDYVLEMERANPNRQIAVLIPEMVQCHWYDNLLHNNRAEVLRTLLLLKGNQRIVIINVPWYLAS